MKLSTSVQRKRGCNYCADKVPRQVKPFRRSYCPHDECPYHQLDGFNTYTEYLKSIHASNITEILKYAGLKRFSSQKK